MFIRKYAYILFLFTIYIIIITIYNKDTCFAQSPETALNSFKKLNIHCNIGISYQDYNRELVEIVFQRKKFGKEIGSGNVSSNEEARQRIRSIKIDVLLGEAELLYLFANEVWGFSFKAPGRDGILFIGKPAWKDFLMIVPSVYDKVYKDPRIFEMGGEKCLRLQYILNIIWNDAAAKLISAETLCEAE